jgi:hypothetical protein
MVIEIEETIIVMIQMMKEKEFKGKKPIKILDHLFKLLKNKYNLNI